MEQIKLSGFADEITSDFKKQCESLQDLEIGYIAIRSINDKNILDFTFKEFKRDVFPILEMHHLKISSIGSPLGKVHIDDTKAQEVQLLKLRELIQIMDYTKTKYLRIFSLFTNEHSEDSFKRVHDFLNRILKLVEGHDIVVLHENEKDIYGDRVENCLKLAKTIRHPQFKLTFDPANFVQVGDHPWEAYLILKPYIVDIHMKDALFKTGENVLIGTGDGSILKLIHVLKTENFDGFYTLEPHLYNFNYLKELEEGHSKNILYRDGYEAFKVSKDAFFELFYKE